jgi:hypothetical protein
MGEAKVLSGIWSNRRREINPPSKLSVRDVLEIRQWARDHESSTRHDQDSERRRKCFGHRQHCPYGILSRRYRVSEEAIKDVICRRSWTRLQDAPPVYRPSAALSWWLTFWLFVLLMQQRSCIPNDELMHAAAAHLRD